VSFSVGCQVDRRKNIGNPRGDSTERAVVIKSADPASFTIVGLYYDWDAADKPRSYKNGQLVPKI
jgi:hypothetical protein